MPSEPAAPLAIKSIQLSVCVGYCWLPWQTLQGRDELRKNLAGLQVEIKAQPFSKDRGLSLPRSWRLFHLTGPWNPFAADCELPLHAPARWPSFRLTPLTPTQPWRLPAHGPAAVTLLSPSPGLQGQAGGTWRRYRGPRNQQQPGLRQRSKDLLTRRVLSSSQDTKGCSPVSQPARNRGCLPRASKGTRHSPPDHISSPYGPDSYCWWGCMTAPAHLSDIAGKVGSLAPSPPTARIHDLGPI